MKYIIDKQEYLDRGIHEQPHPDAKMEIVWVRETSPYLSYEDHYKRTNERWENLGKDHQYTFQGITRLAPQNEWVIEIDNYNLKQFLNKAKVYFTDIHSYPILILE